MRRIHAAHTIAVEVWELPVDGQPLQAWRHHPMFAQRLASVARGLREQPPVHWPASARAAAGRITHVYLTGGGALGAGLSEAFAAQGLATTVSCDPLYGAARAGALGPGSACVDVGQTALKLARGGECWSVPRDLERAPLRDEVPLGQRAEVRASTLDFLAEALAPLARDGERLVLALPCELSAAGLPHGCTYCWRSPDPALLSDLARAAGLSLDVLWVLNDAELAGTAAGLDARVPRDGTVLVLTLGYGVGGALLGPWD